MRYFIDKVNREIIIQNGNEVYCKSEESLNDIINVAIRYGGTIGEYFCYGKSDEILDLKIQEDFETFEEDKNSLKETDELGMIDFIRFLYLERIMKYDENQILTEDFSEIVVDACEYYFDF